MPLVVAEVRVPKVQFYYKIVCGEVCNEIEQQTSEEQGILGIFG
ncbi:MAG: hypothetical protein [aquatic viral metagenome]